MACDNLTESLITKEQGYRELKAESENKVEESYEARKKFPNAKSISSAQFFGDHNKCSLDKFLLMNDFSLVVDKTKEKLETLASMIFGGLQMDLTKLMQILYREDANPIPFDTRLEWVRHMHARVANATEGPVRPGKTAYALRWDVCDLTRLVYDNY